MKLWALETHRQEDRSSRKLYMSWMQRGEIQEAAETEKVVDLELPPGMERGSALGESSRITLPVSC